MSTTVHDCLEAEKSRREESGDRGFSLIELIVVVVILGVLAAIAIPVFLNIQGTAEVNALKASAANGATQVSAAVASSDTKAPKQGDSLAGLSRDGVTVTVTRLAGSDLATICVTAAKTGVVSQTSGPGC